MLTLKTYLSVHVSALLEEVLKINRVVGGGGGGSWFSYHGLQDVS